jgi:DNA-binding MarR family transcriptional regulator
MSPALELQRAEAVEQVATLLLPQASLLTRLVAKQAHWTVTRSEGGMLSTLSAGPQRITALAEVENLAQPTVTILVKRLEERGWVARGKDPDDGRVVVVSLTDAGRGALESFREQYRALLRDYMAGLTDEQVAELVGATRALGRLVEALQ